MSFLNYVEGGENLCSKSVGNLIFHKYFFDIIYHLYIIYILFCFLAAPHIYVPPRFRELACFEKGENVTLKIPFTGFPKPKIKWSKEGEEIESGLKYDVSVGERHALLTIRDVHKYDNGPYRIVAENELGVDSAIIKVQINGTFIFCKNLNLPLSM